MKKFLELIKIKHWIKNTFIFGPLIFSLYLLQFDKVLRTLIAFFAFSFVSVLVYILNDIKDKDSDASHPIKALRPIASGQIKPAKALFVGLLFGITGFGLAVYLGMPSFLVVSLYFILNIFYILILKNFVILDVIIISIGFCLRVLLGAFVISVTLSNWMLFTTFAVSLMLGFGKRRHELEYLGLKAQSHRNSLKEYDKPFLDMLIMASTSITIISYALYTMDPDVTRKFGTEGLIYTVPFVLYGLFRYLHLVHSKGKGGKPQEVVVNDPGIIITVVLWFILIILLIYFKDVFKFNIFSPNT
jgi:decaprenyl-phosphate phosphoribosyltransferase